MLCACMHDDQILAVKILLAYKEEVQEGTRTYRQAGARKEGRKAHFYDLHEENRLVERAGRLGPQRMDDPRRQFSACVRYLTVVDLYNL